MNVYFQGLTMGLAYVAPIGPQNLFVINTALGCPRRRALRTACAVIFFDITLALACFFGIGALLARWAWLEKLILWAGGVFVAGSGLRLLRAKPDAPGEAPPPGAPLRSAAFAFAVTWCNPQAILSGTMMLGAFRAALPSGQALPFVLGTASASCLWFLGLTLAVSALRGRFSAGVMRGIDRVCGAVLVFYGLRLLASG